VRKEGNGVVQIAGLGLGAADSGFPNVGAGFCSACRNCLELA